MAFAGSPFSSRQCYDRSLQLFASLAVDISEIKELIRLQKHIHVYDEQSAQLRKKLAAQQRAIVRKDTEIARLQAEVDLLTQAIRKNEYIIDWLDNAADVRSVQNFVELPPKPPSAIRKRLAKVCAIFA